MRSKALLFLTCLAAAPIPSVQGQQSAPATSQDSPATGSYLDTSFEAREAFDRACKLADSGDWMLAAQAMQTVGERHGEKLIAVTATRYVAIRQLVNERICTWPAEGLTAYRSLFEAAASAMLEDARRNEGRASLAAVADRYFPTHSGASALDEAGERAMEAGDFRTAARDYARLIRLHPSGPDTKNVARSGELVVWKTKAALCDAWMGEDSPARKLRAELTNDDAALKVSPASGGKSIAALLDDAMQFAASVEHRAAADGSSGTVCATAMLGQDLQRRNYVESTATAEARLWKFSSFEHGFWEEELAGYESSAAKKDAWQRLIQSGRLLACVPVADCRERGGGRVYLHDANTVWAVDPKRPDKPAWRFDLGTKPVSRPMLSADDEPAPQFTTTLHDDRLYVPLEIELPATASGQTLYGSVLVCLSAADGRLIWKTPFDSLASNFEEVRLDGAPMIHRDGCFTLARRRKPFGFEACYLVRLDPGSGAIQWSVHLGEAATGSYGYHRATVSHPAADGSLIFAETNLGTIAAVDADTGRTEWITQYDTKSSDSPDGFWPTRMGRPTRAWQYPAMVAWRDAIVAFPLDGDQLIVLNQFDGTERFHVDAEKLFNPEVIVGLRHDVIYLAGSQVVAYDLSTRSPVWQRQLETGQVFGRPALTSQGVFIPTERALLRYPIGGGAAQVLRWSAEEAGNLTVTGDQIIVSAPASLYALSARAEALAGLRQSMESSPSDAAPALALAELAFNTGDAPAGLEAVREAVKRMGGYARMSDESSRRRLFNQVMQFAGTLINQLPAGSRSADDPPISDSTATAAELLQIAAQCAPDSNGRVAYRLLLARVQLARKEIPDALATYQQVLNDRGLRLLRLPLTPVFYPPQSRATGDSADNDDSLEIGIQIEQWVNRIINEAGRNAYAKIEDQASERLQRAAARNDIEAIFEVAEAFPNSATAGQARVRHARMMMQAGRLKEATRSFYRSVLLSEQRDRPTIIRDYAECLMKAGCNDLAAQWLARGARDDAKLRGQEGPARIDFDALSRAWFADKLPRSSATPIGFTRLGEPFNRLYPEKTAVLDPQEITHRAGNWDMIIVYCGGMLEARSPTTGAAVWAQPRPCLSLPQLLGLDEKHCYFATGHRIFALTRTSGQQAWSVGEEPRDDPAEDPESTPAWSGLVLSADRLFAATEAGELQAIDPTSGAILWHRQVHSPIGGHFAADSRYVCYATWIGRKHTIHILDAKTGAAVAQAAPQEEWPVQALTICPDGDLLVTFSNAIHAIDPASGKERFRIGGERFVASSLFFDQEGILVSPDGRRLARYDAENGRGLWMSAAVTSGPADGFWSQVADGVVYASTGEFVAAFDTSDGRTLWNVRAAAGTRVDSPRLSTEGVVIGMLEPDGPGPSKKDEPKATSNKTYRFVQFSRVDGSVMQLNRTSAIVTEPLGSFAGFFLRDHALIVLDGNRLLGYAQNP